MYVHDLEASRKFFVEFFDGKANDGYHNPRTGFSSYFISFDDGARLEIMNRPETPDCSGTSDIGYAHIAFSVGSKENVNALTEKLRGAGYTVTSGPRVTGDGYYESCIVGIEGNTVEITV